MHFAFAPHPGIHIEATDLEWFLFRLNPRKVTPKDTAPALLVKACAHSLSRSTAQQLNAIWGQGGHYVPTRWSDADVALLWSRHMVVVLRLWTFAPLGYKTHLAKQL